MESESKWLLTDTEKARYIETFSPNLPALRTKAGISQEELANLIGVSRQTYSAIERNVRKMAWSTYLSLVFFFDHNQKTHKMLRMLSLFPKELIIRFNDGVDYSNFELGPMLGSQAEDMLEQLDEQAKQIVGSTIKAEYSRCTRSPGEAAVKSFDGKDLLNSGFSAKDIEALKALRAILRDQSDEE